MILDLVDMSMTPNPIILHFESVQLLKLIQDNPKSFLKQIIFGTSQILEVTRTERTRAGKFEFLKILNVGLISIKDNEMLF